jgi:hypothetical protein
MVWCVIPGANECGLQGRKKPQQRKLRKWKLRTTSCKIAPRSCVPGMADCLKIRRNQL